MVEFPVPASSQRQDKRLKGASRNPHKPIDSSQLNVLHLHYLKTLQIKSQSCNLKSQNASGSQRKTLVSPSHITICYHYNNIRKFVCKFYVFQAHSNWRELLRSPCLYCIIYIICFVYVIYIKLAKLIK